MKFTHELDIIINNHYQLVEGYIMLTRIGLVVFSLLIVGSAALGDDFSRKGPVFGLGIGIAPLADYSYESRNWMPDSDDSEMGLGFNFAFGYAIGEFNMIALAGNGAISDGNSATRKQGYFGPTWYVFFSRTEKTAFLTLGPGVYLYGERTFYDPGFGFMAGLGFHVGRQWQVGCYFAHGTTNGGKNTHDQLNMLVSFMSF